MTTINLKDFYAWYTHDEYIEVSDEVAAELKADKLYEAAYQRRTTRVVFYSVSESSLHTRMFQRSVPNFDFVRYINETGKSMVVLFRRNAVTIQTIKHLKENNLRFL